MLVHGLPIPIADMYSTHKCLSITIPDLHSTHKDYVSGWGGEFGKSRQVEHMFLQNEEVAFLIERLLDQASNEKAV
eukprot:10849758-Prorocentrum_lima.AAC.1